MISALVTAGLEGGYLANPRLAKVHWQAGDRPMPPPRVTVAGESALWVNPAEVPADADVAGLIITVDRKVVEVAGHLYVEAPKNRKYRRTIYPRRTPAGYPLAEQLAARVEQASAEQAAMPPTCPAWPATPTTASPSTCTSAPPPASWTAPGPPPNKYLL
jgi:hypothetical protein